MLCNATDGKLVAGHFPGVDRYPCCWATRAAGIVREVGPEVRSFAVGDRAIGGLVFDIPGSGFASGWGGFCEYTLVTDHDAMVEDGVADAEHGWFECNEIQRKRRPGHPGGRGGAALHLARGAAAASATSTSSAGQDVLIFGAGPVGLSFVKLCKLAGLRWVGVVDPLPRKRSRAEAMGADRTFAPDDPALDGLVKARGAGLDAVIDAVGSPKIVNRALPLVKLGGSVCVYGVIADPAFQLEKGTGPYNFNLLVHQWPTRHRERAAQAPLCELVRQGPPARPATSSPTSSRWSGSGTPWRRWPAARC